MKRTVIALPLALSLFLLAAGSGALAAETPEATYRIDLTRPGSGEITVTIELEAVSGPLVLELPDSYGNGLAAGLSSHVSRARALDEAGRELALTRDGDSWSVDSTGRITVTYEVDLSGYAAGTAYLDSIASSDIPWPYFPLLREDFAYLPGYAVLMRPRGAQGYAPRLELDLPPRWRTASAWAEKPAAMDELLYNPILAGELTVYEQGPILLALPASAAAASQGSLSEYAQKAQALLAESERILGGLELEEGQRLLLALLFRGEGEALGNPYYPSSPFSSTVVIPAAAGSNPLSDAAVEATARGMVSLLLSHRLDVDGGALWLKEGSAWYLQNLVPYQAGLWGAGLFWDRFNRSYDIYRGALSAFGGSLAQAGPAGYGSGEAAMALTCGGAAACAALDSGLRALQPNYVDFPSFLRSLCEISGGGLLSNQDVLSALNDLTGRDWSAFFRDHVEGAAEIPASAFSSLNVAGSGGSSLPGEIPEPETSTSQWVVLALAVLVVLIIPFVLEPYTLRPRKPGFLERELGKDEED